MSPRPRLTIEILGKPQTKKRPRRTDSGHVYTPSSQVESDIAFTIRAHTHAAKVTGEVGVAMYFYGANVNADLDNLAKLYLDALVKAGTIEDDRNVAMLLLVRKPKDGDGPRTKIIVVPR